MKNFKILPFMIFLFLINCATINIDHVEDPANQLSIDSLKLEMGVEPTEYRVDLIRKMEITTETQTDQNGKSKTTTKESEKSYSPIGFYINDYLFFDLNYNLGFDVYKYFDEQHEGDFTIHHEAVCLFKIGSTLEKKDDIITVYSNFLKLPKRKIIPITEDKLTIHKGLFDWKSDVMLSDNELAYQPVKCFKKITSQRIIKKNNKYIVPILFWKQKVEKVSQSEIQLQNNMNIILKDNHIVFEQPFIFDLSDEYQYVELRDGIAFYNAFNIGVEIKLFSESVEVIKHGRVTDVYRIEAR